MNTIKERAIKAVPDILRINSNYVESYRTGYCQGATEQNKIDIEKACKWLKEHAFVFAEAECTSTWDAVVKYDTDLLINHFRKAMEE